MSYNNNFREIQSILNDQQKNYTKLKIKNSTQSTTHLLYKVLPAE